MYARVNHFQNRPEEIEASERFAEERILPELRSVPGFLGVLSLVDRATGGSLAITFWESEGAMAASEDEADRLREATGRSTGTELRTVDRYEVALRVGV